MDRNEKHVWSVKPVEPFERRAFERHAYRLLRTSGEGDSVAVGLDRSHEFQGEKVRLKKAVMPSSHNSTVRLSVYKWYNPVVKRKRGSSGARKGSKTQVVDNKALEALMSELGLS